MDRPLMADAIGTTVGGGMLGTSTVTTYIESATGVEEGGRTGLTALVVAHSSLSPRSRSSPSRLPFRPTPHTSCWSSSAS